MEKNIYFLDTETTQSNFYQRFNKTEVRIIVLSNKLQSENSKQFKCNRFLTMEDLMTKLMTLPDHSIIFVCNLNFDGKFIVDYLANHLEWLDTINEEDFKGKKPLNKEHFSIDDPYLIDFCIGAYLTSLKIRFYNKRTIEFRCFFKLYANVGKVSDFGKLVGLPKLEEDVKVYDCTHEEFMNHSKKWINDRFGYAKRDIEIPYRFAQQDWNTNADSPMRMKKIPLTAASLSMKITKKKAPMLFKWLWIQDKDKTPHLDKHDDKEWLEYRGGFTFQKKENSNQVLTNIYSIDINSSYPYQYTTYKVPCRKPILRDTLPAKLNLKNLYSIYIHITKAIIKNPKMDFPPFLAKNNLKVKGRYIKYFIMKEEPIKLMIWTEELKWLEKYYHLEYTIQKCYQFETTNYLIKHTRELVDKKFTTQNKIEKALIKILINSLYGKFGQKPEMVSKYYDIYTNTWNRRVTISPNIRYYPPVASYITMKGRTQLYKGIENILSLGGIVYYGDTDSLKFGNISQEILHENKEFLKIGDSLGEWKLEDLYKKFKYLAPKVYMSINQKDEVKTILKGYNGKNTYSIEDFNYGITYEDKTEQLKVEGGIIIIDDKTYELNENEYLIEYNVGGELWKNYLQNSKISLNDLRNNQFNRKYYQKNNQNLLTKILKVIS